MWRYMGYILCNYKFNDPKYSVVSWLNFNVPPEIPNLYKFISRPYFYDRFCCLPDE